MRPLLTIRTLRENIKIEAMQRKNLEINKKHSIFHHRMM
jgi:hypothetical protein